MISFYFWGLKQIQSFPIACCFQLLQLVYCMYFFIAFDQRMNWKISHFENERYETAEKSFSFLFQLLLYQMTGPSPPMGLWHTAILDRINNHRCLHYSDPQLPVAVLVSVLPQSPLRHSADCLNSQPTDSTTKVTGLQVSKILPIHKVLYVP